MTTVPAALRRLGADLPATFWWLFAGVLVNSLATFVFPFLALFLTSRGLSAAEAGLLVAVFGGGSIVAGPLAGWCADRFGRRPVILGSLLASAVLSALLAGAGSGPALVAVTAALGLFANAFRPATQATIADVVPAGQRPQAFGLLYWAVNLGMALSLLVGGAIASQGYGRLFLADAATTAAFAALVWRRVPETRPAHAHGPAPAAAGSWRDVLSDRVFVGFFALNLAFLLAFLQFQVALPIDMARRGLPPAAFGRVLSVNGFLIAIVQPWAARAVRRLDPSHALAAAAVLVGAGYGAYALATTATHYALATAVWSLGEIMALPVAGAFVADLSPAHLRGRYQGAFGVCWGAAMLGAPATGGVVLDRFGAGAIWWGCLVAGALVAAGHLALAGSRRRELSARAAAGASPG